MRRIATKAMSFLRTVILILACAGWMFSQTPAKPKAAPATTPKTVARPAASGAAATSREDEAEIPPETPGAMFPAVVARVNDRPILGRNAERRVQAELAPLGNPEWKNLKEDYRQELVRKALASLVAEELVYQSAVTGGFKATEAEVQAEFAKAASTFGSDAAMNIALHNRGLDRAAFTRELGRNLTVQKYIKETIGKKIVVTPSEVTQYYNEHRDQFNHPDLVKSSHILILVAESSTPDQQKLALQQAESLLARIRKGEDFARLAKEYSMDPSASNGGDIGFLPKGSLAPQYEEAAFALPVGGVSDLVRTQLGYHIIKVTDKKKAGIAELEELRSNLGEYIKNQRIDAEMRKIVAALHKAAKVVVLVPLVAPLDPGETTTSNPRP